nr:uncharacterized protein LOC127339384 [Lolium perenne]
MPLDWEWGLLPLSSLNPPTDEAKQRFPRIAAEQRGPPRNRALDKVDPDPYIHWTDLKMGRTHTSRPDAPSASTNPQVHEHVVPLQAEVGHEFLEKLSSQEKRKAPAPEASSSEVPPAKRPKKPSKRHYPSAQDFQERFRHASGKLRRRRKAFTSSSTKSDYRAEEDIVSTPKNQDTGASNTSADTEDAGQTETLVSTVPQKKKKTSASSPSTSVPKTSAPGAPDASAPPKSTSMPPPASSAGGSSAAKPPTPPPSQEPVVAKTKLMPPPEGAKLRVSEHFKAKATTSDPQSLVLHSGPAAVVAGERATGLLGRITELKREGRELGHLLDYAEKWNQADVSAATRGVGKDRLPIIDPAGPRSTEEHFMRLKRVVKEFDNAWHGATSNVVVLFFPDSYISSQFPTIPEASLEALKTQVGNLQAEKEQLIRDHQKALDAQKTISRELKEQAIQATLRHDQELKDAKAAAEARLAEVVDDSANSTAVLRAELEEMGKFQKAAEDQVARLTAEQKEYDELVTRTDALALRLFPDSQVHTQKKVSDRRIAQQFQNLAAPWDPYDHLVALSARVQHMRTVDRHLDDLPDVAIQLYKVLWPGEALPANLTLTSERLKDARRRIREWHLRQEAPTDTDPVLTAKRKDRAYQIAEYAPVRTFIPPPPGVEDWLNDEGEEEEEEEEDAEDAPPEGPEAGDAPPEAPIA